MIKTITNLFWKFVFFWKKRTGWIELEKSVRATGVVVKIEKPGLDGDGNFDIRLDEGQDWLITGFGGRLTTTDESLGPSLHCEVAPWADETLRLKFACLDVGDHVVVSGTHGFDGVHTGRSEWIETILAAVRHQPNVKDGWFEIHPVTKIEVIK